MRPTPNPYVSRGPLRQAEMFYGRQAELQRLADFLQGSQPVALVGPEEIGKSSLLFHLMRPATQESLGLGPEYLFSYIDCEALGESEEEMVFGRLAAELATSLQERALPPEPALDEALQRPGPLTFEAVMRRLADRGLRLVFLLDEFQHLSANPNLDLTFFNRLASITVRYGLVWVVAVDRPLLELDRTRTHPSPTLLTSPFFTSFASLFLGLLGEEEARRLICEPANRAGVAFPPQTVDFIYSLVGGHPEALQIACFHAFETPTDLAEIERRTLAELQEHHAAAWRSLSPHEQDLLQRMNTLSTRTSDTTVRGVLRGLAQKGLLQADGESYRYPSRAWADFVAAQAPVAGGAFAQALTAGRRFGPYEILEPLGRGGQAEVYKGRHIRLERLAAIKILPARLAEEEDFRQRFEREARAVAALRHPNIVQVFDFGEAEGITYIVMEYIEGKDLGKLLKENGPFDPPAARPILRDLGGALGYAHRLGIVHRDLKPSNVLIQLPGSQAFLSDFGIAKILRSDTTSATRTGLMMGTLNYMAPEQIRSAAAVDRRADLYALGVVLFQMFTGELPFQADNPGAVMLMHLTQPAPDPRALRPDLPAPLAEAVLRCLAKEPDERFASVEELLEALQMEVW